MIREVRDLMKNMGGMRVKMGGPMPEWLYNMEKVSVQMKVMIVCLMYYYLHNRTFSFHYVCVGLFDRCNKWINPEKIKSLETQTNTDELLKMYPVEQKRVAVTLGNFFEKMIRELIDTPEITEVDIEQIARNLYKEYFVEIV